jgi:hypothetical protein
MVGHLGKIALEGADAKKKLGQAPPNPGLGFE